MIDPLFEEWRAYQKLVENNYMGHAQFFQRLAVDTGDRFHDPIAILDLGCGDSTPVQALLQGILALSGFSYRLLAGDILETTRESPQSFDLIIASFSLHHLQDQSSKKELLQACRRVLDPGGVFAIIDVFLDDAESRDDYLGRFERQARKNYSALNDLEMTTLITHVRDCDYPESVATYRRLGLQAGFKEVRSLLRDEASLHQLVLLE